MWLYGSGGDIPVTNLQFALLYRKSLHKLFIIVKFVFLQYSCKAMEDISLLLLLSLYFFITVVWLRRI